MLNEVGGERYKDIWNRNMLIVESAKKHGISDQDIEYVYEFAVNSIVFQKESGRRLVMLFGFDRIGRGLEVGYVTTDQGEDIVIHAMKIRQGYKQYLYERKGIFEQ
jgi:hypothetical protein